MVFCCKSIPHFIWDRHMLKYALICASNATAADCGVFLFADQWERGSGCRAGRARARSLVSERLAVTHMLCVRLTFPQSFYFLNCRNSFPGIYKACHCHCDGCLWEGACSALLPFIIDRVTVNSPE